MTLLRGLGFVSLCEHHLLPFFGQVHVGCIPRDPAWACDPAACAEVVEALAHRPQLQERMTEEVADALFAALRPEGLGVAVEGRHLCMMMRGVGKHGAEIRTSSLRGSFLDPGIRRTFFVSLYAARDRS